MKKNLILIILIFLIIGFLFLFWQGIYLPKEPLSEKEIIFNIEKGQGSKEIALNLKKEGLIKYPTLFRIYVLNKGVAGELKAGTYLFSPAMNVPQIVEKLAKGDVLKEKITIIEGWNLKDIGWYFEGKGMFQTKEFFELVGFPLVDYSKTKDILPAKDFSQEFSFLKDKPKEANLEGYLFPDTYEITKEDKLEGVIRKILKNLDKKLTLELREEISRQNKSIFEVITTASIIEKEVRTYEDKQIVSGIFWKRIKEKKPLQSCATIAYIKGVPQWRYSFADTRIESPYNTYLNLGLPLGPICNPGLESILAALYPKESKYWYYLSTPEGETIFSKTLKEHNSAKAEYLK